MGRVSLILPLPEAARLSTEALARYRSGLEGAGHSVQVIAVLDGQAAAMPSGLVPGVDQWLVAPASGLAFAAIFGLSKADGEVLMVLDPAQGFAPEDLLRTIEPIRQERADLVIACRESTTSPPGRLGPLRMAKGWSARLARQVLGASDPFSGLVALRPALADELAGSFIPVGDRYAIDLLVRSKGRRAEVSAPVDSASSHAAIGWDDLRHFKRLADDRYGNLSRLLQFCAVGASGMVVDLSCYALFQLVFSRTALVTRHAPVVGGTLDLAVSGALAIALALTWNFSLNRRLTFSYARYGSVLRQFVTYAMSNALGIALSFTLRLTLPARIAFFHDHKLAAAVVGIVTATGISFSLARWVVFNPRVGPGDDDGSEPEVVGSPANSFSH